MTARWLRKDLNREDIGCSEVRRKAGAAECGTGPENQVGCKAETRKGC